MKEKEAEKKLRLVEMLLLIASILFALGKFDTNQFLFQVSFFSFLISAILYHIIASINEMNSYIACLVAVTFSLIISDTLATIISPSVWWRLFIIFLYFFVFVGLLSLTLNEEKTIRKFLEKFIPERFRKK